LTKPSFACAFEKVVQARLSGSEAGRLGATAAADSKQENAKGQGEASFGAASPREC
jgi:hypothetical protein